MSQKSLCRLLAVAAFTALSLAGFAQTGANAAPVVLNHSETAQPGDIIYCEGVWGSTVSVMYEVVSSTAAPNVATAQSLSLVASNAGNTHNSGSYVSVQIPVSAPVGLYALWLNDGSGWSAPTFVNQAHGTHCEFSQISPGFTFSVFGRNLTLPGYTPSVSFVDTTTSTSYPGTAYPAQSTSNYLNVSAPANVVVGHAYNVIVNNGAGSSSGNSQVEEGTTIEWANGVAAPATTISGSSVPWNLNVPWQADFDSFCNRVIDPTQAPYNVTAGGYTTAAAAAANAQGLQLAMNAAKQAGGGVVYLPAGNYAFDYYQSQTGIMYLPPHVVIMGAGSSSTILSYGYSAPPLNSENCLFYRTNASTNGWLNLGLTNVNGSYGERPSAGWGNEFFVMGCVLNNGTAPSIDNEGQNFYLFENSSNIESGQNSGQFYMHGNEGVIFANSSLSYNCSRNWAGPGGGISDALFFNNHITRTAAVPSVSGYEAGGFDMYGNRVVFLNNTFDVAAGNAPNINNNDGEQILSEYGGGSYQDSGQISSATTNTITDTLKSWPAGVMANGGTSESALANQTAVMIVSGPETGEWSYITANTGTTITVSPAWPVTPAPGSEYEVEGWTATEWLIANNTFSNNVRGIYFNGTCWNNVVVNNTMTNDDGILLPAVQGARGYFAGGGGTDLTDPQLVIMIWDTQIDNNVISDSSNPQQYIPSELTAIDTVDNDSPQILGTAILGLECRRNSLTVDTPNCGFDQSIPTPGTLSSRDNHILGENYINTVVQQYDPDSPVAGDPHYNWFLFPCPPPYDTNDTGILGSIYQGNISANQTGADISRLWNGTNFTSYGSAYWLGTGVYDTIIADPSFTNVSMPVYDPNGLNYNSIPATGSLIDYQAEYGTLAGGANIQTDTYASGGEIVGAFNGVGASCTLSNIDGDAGGTHLLTIRYATQKNPTLDLYVNGSTKTATIAFPYSGGWYGAGNYNTVTLAIQLNAGTANTIKFQYDAGNDSVNIDKVTISPATLTANLTPPSTTASFTGTAGTNGWYTSPVTVALAATDDSGSSYIASTSYTIDGGTTQTYGSPFALSADGIHSVTYWSTDIDGNVETSHSLIVKIDSTAPTLSFGSATPSANSNGWNNSAVTIPFSPADATSGVASTSPTSSPLSFSAEGAGQTQTVTVTDNAGNAATFTSPTVSIDLTPPTTSGTFVSPTVTLTASDALSGVAATYYTLDGGAQTAYSSSFAVTTTTSHTIEYWSVDNAGNVEIEHTLTTVGSNPAPTLTAVSPTTLYGGGSAAQTLTVTGTGFTAASVVNWKGSALPSTYVSSTSLTATVASSLLTASGSATVTVTNPAPGGGISGSKTVTIKNVTVTKIAFSPTSVFGGASTTATVTISATAPAGYSVALTNSAPSAATVPASLSFVQGATTATLTIPSAQVLANTPITIGATGGGTTKSAMFTIDAPTVSRAAFTESVNGGLNATATITITSAAPAGYTVALTNSTPSIATIPSSVTFATGATTASFNVPTVPVTSNVVVTLTATGNGVTKSGILTVKPPTFTSLTLSPTSVKGGSANSTGTITIISPAPTGGEAFTVSSSSASAATVPTTVTVLAGATTATFPITTNTVAATTSVTITATGLGATKTAKVNVTH